jgi:hypothetical protein
VILAKEHGVSHSVIERDGQFARAVDTLPEVKAKIQRGEKVIKKDLIMHRVYERKKKSRGNPNYGTKNQSGHFVHIGEQGRTRDIVGKDMGLTGRTVSRAADFGRAIDSLGDLGSEVKAKIQRGEKV